MAKTHTYELAIEWTGNTGTGTKHFAKYKRDHVISADGKVDILGSSDPAFMGDPKRWNPEEMLLSSIATCHKLWYLHLCFDNGITVTKYTDTVTGEMVENPDGSGEFKVANLNPVVTISEGDPDLAKRLHGKVGDLCFIARSVNFEITHSPTILVE